MIKAIICDLDRTLLRTDKTISPRTLSVMRSCHDRGLLLMAATARPIRAISTYQEQVSFDAVTTMNGASVVLPGSTLFTGIPKASALRLVRQLSRLPDAVISLETSSGIFSNRDIPQWQPAVYPELAEAPLPDAIYKLLVSAPQTDLSTVLPGLLPEDTYYTVANGSLYQVMHRDATKWHGICQMLNHFRIDPAQAVYFGDDWDDLEPIRRCGTGVAVANGIPEVLSAADQVTCSNDEDGVAAWLEANLFT